MDVNVKGLDEDVVRRLSEQAQAEGVSAQEWMRQSLRRTAALLTPRELDARIAERTPVSADRYAEVMEDITARRPGPAGSPPGPGPRGSGVRRRRR